ncbi:MAG TPA: nitrilase-related carbon-nitrogen hydrolase, partial [Arthrobacter sp.]|nr:nitrilase-related carbon-nitrogen hydrolase [Arthrobacter sp.]
MGTGFVGCRAGNVEKQPLWTFQNGYTAAPPAVVWITQGDTMSDYSKKLRVAAVQAEPVWNDLNGGVDKTIQLMREATEHGADLVAFPEVWIPGYPWFLWLDSVAWQSQFQLAYAQNSLDLEGPEYARIEEAARDLGIAVSLGFSERSGGSLYIAQAFVDATGTTRTTRRKLKPTHVERTLFGEGDGSDI